ncbi:MAG: nitrite reductase large subunit NirB [Ilumatobacter sp.]
MSSPRHLVVVGNGMVGQKLLDELIARPELDWAITVVGDEPVGAYDRVALSSWFDGASDEDLSLCDVEAMRRHGVNLCFGRKVETIDRVGATVTLDDGAVLAYDHLVLATGSAPFVPPVPGRDVPGCFVYRTLDDLRQISAWSEVVTTDGRTPNGVVIGGGLLGLEAANALQNLGLRTRVVEMADRLMPQQLDPAASGMLHRWVQALDIDTHLGFATQQIEADTIDGVERVARLRGADGSIIDADIVVFSAGVRPRHQLADACGLEIGVRGGVVIDDTCTTSDERISAIGEVACHGGMTYGLVGPGYSMARVLADRLCGGADTFAGADLSTKLKLLGVDVASFGQSALVESDDQVVFADPIARVHRRIAVRDGNVVGGVLVGDVSNYEALHAMSTGTMATKNVAGIVLPDGLSPSDTTELPDTSQLCSCNNVLRGDVKTAIEAGCCDLASLKSETTAGTGCGGCLPGLATLLNSELEARGVTVDRSLCEHFAHSRQELFDLIRFHHHRTWAEVLAAHGTGRGCAVCRPTVGSILSSLSAGYILDGDQAGLQDTNDHALANMQRNGTYSVIPRVPGGEITPAQLIELGRIAGDFELYVKITGAQRIDLLGAQLHQLPSIWQRVIDAGMESGHAYGKALRTVKSCVGNTWCRYGVQDSVTMAIDIERRYRGLRAPHKLKSAVSGCTRECAEAQSKDFGVIATETGWNLYLCGNGGRVPRHAELFATDLTDTELIRYIDRFLMFYIRTADRLERTAPWFERLDGGMEYLRSVIVDDVLGICDELEADMAAHVDSYECEWAATLDDPERLEQFVEFVNAPEIHSTPVWVVERGQRIPAAAGAMQ